MHTEYTGCSMSYTSHCVVLCRNMTACSLSKYPSSLASTTQARIGPYFNLNFNPYCNCSPNFHCSCNCNCNPNSNPSPTPNHNPRDVQGRAVLHLQGGGGGGSKPLPSVRSVDTGVLSGRTAGPLYGVGLRALDPGAVLVQLRGVPGVLSERREVGHRVVAAHLRAAAALRGLLHPYGKHPHLFAMGAVPVSYCFFFSFVIVYSSVTLHRLASLRPCIIASLHGLASPFIALHLNIALHPCITSSLCIPSNHSPSSVTPVPAARLSTP
jgi:hypothetical protein